VKEEDCDIHVYGEQMMRSKEAMFCFLNAHRCY